MVPRLRMEEWKIGTGTGTVHRIDSLEKAVCRFEHDVHIVRARVVPHRTTTTNFRYIIPVPWEHFFYKRWSLLCKAEIIQYLY